MRPLITTHRALKKKCKKKYTLPLVRIELTTPGLQDQCSATELKRRFTLTCFQRIHRLDPRRSRLITVLQDCSTGGSVSAASVYAGRLRSPRFTAARRGAAFAPFSLNGQSNWRTGVVSFVPHDASRARTEGSRYATGRIECYILSRAQLQTGSRSRRDRTAISLVARARARTRDSTPSSIEIDPE